MKYRSLLIGAAAAILGATLAAQGQVPGVNSTLQAVFNLVYDNSTMKPTFSGSATFAPGTTDMCSISGSATRNVRVRRIYVAGIASAVQTEPILIEKRSTAYTGGVGAALGSVPYDTINSLTSAANSATAAQVEQWTTGPTVGTPVGIVATKMITWSNATTGVGLPAEFNFGELASPIVLRGVAQIVGVNIGGGAPTSVTCTIEWTEE